jgi:thioredoxin-related protein
VLSLSYQTGCDKKVDYSKNVTYRVLSLQLLKIMKLRNFFRSPVKALETMTNVAIIFVAIMLGVTLINNHSVGDSKPAAKGEVAVSDEQTLIGSRVDLRDVNWQKNGRTLVLALSTSCHFCSESADFYRRLAKAGERGSATHLIAVLPQEENQGRRYLDGLGVKVDEVRQVSFDSLGIAGTPTLLLVNGDGDVIKSWVGKLPGEEENEVLNSVSTD